MPSRFRKTRSSSPRLRSSTFWNLIVLVASFDAICLRPYEPPCEAAVRVIRILGAISAGSLKSQVTRAGKPHEAGATGWANLTEYGQWHRCPQIGWVSGPVNNAGDLKKKL